MIFWLYCLYPYLQIAAIEDAISLLKNKIQFLSMSISTRENEGFYIVQS